MKQVISSFLFLFLCQLGFAQNFKLKLTDHLINIESVAYSQDGKQFASGGLDGTINLYTIDSSGNPTFSKSLNGHLASVNILNFSKNGKYLVSSSKDLSSRIWNLDTLDKSKIINFHLELVTASFLDATNKYLISTSLDGNIRISNLNDFKKSKTIKLNAPIADLKISTDNKFYYVAFKNGTIKKIETKGKNEEIMVFKGHGDEINSIDLSSDGNVLASGSSDKSIILWDVLTGKQLKKLIGFEWKVNIVRFSSDGNYIVGGGNDGETKLFEVSSGKNLQNFKELGRNVRCLCWSKTGEQIAVATIQEGEKFGAVVYNTGVKVETKSSKNNVPPANSKSKSGSASTQKKPLPKK